MNRERISSDYTVLTLIFLTLLSLPLGALEEEIILGRESGWGRINHRQTLQEARGFQGFSDILLTDAAYIPDTATDLLLHFDSPAPLPSLIRRSEYAPGNITWENQPHYRIIPHNIGGENSLHMFGSGAALFSGEESSISLTPTAGALFYPGTDWRDFTMEFWLYPAETESAQELFHWEGVTLPGEWGTESRTQRISCAIGSNRITWRFSTFFRPPDQKNFSVELSGRRELLPRQWHHHMVRFSGETGLLEYLIDGVLEDYGYSNFENRESGTVFTPFTGSASRKSVILGTNLEGVMDEFRISSVYRQNVPPSLYQGQNGTAILAPVDLKHAKSRLVTIKSSYITPGDSDIFFFYSLNESPAALDESDTSWIPFVPGAIFSPETRGRYLHLMAALYPDGKELHSPVLSDLSILYEPDLPPAPPARVTALAEDGAVVLSWEPVPDPDVQGYKIYYGTSPGRYFGTTGEQGASPIDAGSVSEFRLTGLTNGRLYYFSVVAYDESPRPFQTLFSTEVSARPRRTVSSPGGES